MPKSSHITEEVDGLFELRPGEFIVARDLLAKRLRADGHRAEAAEVHALARPTVAAWAVNQLARREPEWMQALATAGERLERAHQGLLRRGDRDGWRAATAGQRQAIDQLVRLAERLLREERGSVSASLRAQVRDTLHAATLDAGARALVLAGRLTRELRSGGTLPMSGRATGDGGRGATADTQGRFTRAAPGTNGDPQTGRGRITARPIAGGPKRGSAAAADEGSGAAAAAAGEGSSAPAAAGGRAGAAGSGAARAGAGSKPSGEGRAGGAAKGRAGEKAAAGGGGGGGTRSSGRGSARTSRANRATSEREARAARRAAERDARAVLRRTERERSGAEVSVERADQAFERARKGHEAALDALAEAEQAARERAEDLSIAEDARSEARGILAAREAAVAEARDELQRATSG